MMEQSGTHVYHSSVFVTYTSEPASMLANRHTDRFLRFHKIRAKVEALLCEIPLDDAAIRLGPVTNKLLDDPIEPFQGVHIM